MIFCGLLIFKLKLLVMCLFLNVLIILLVFGYICEIFCRVIGFFVEFGVVGVFGEILIVFCYLKKRSLRD